MNSKQKYEEMKEEKKFTLGVVDDEIVKRVKTKLDVRSAKGQNDYGTTLFCNKYDNYLKHLQEELLDGANYVEAYLEHKNNRLRVELVKFGNYLLSEERNSDKKHVTDADLENYKNK